MSKKNTFILYIIIYIIFIYRNYMYSICMYMFLYVFVRIFNRSKMHFHGGGSSLRTVFVYDAVIIVVYKAH